MIEAYEMQRKTVKKKSNENNEIEDIINRNKLGKNAFFDYFFISSEQIFIMSFISDDAKLTQFEEAPEIKPIRVSYARHETDWQKKRREQSAQVIKRNKELIGDFRISISFLF